MKSYDELLPEERRARITRWLESIPSEWQIYTFDLYGNPYRTDRLARDRSRKLWNNRGWRRRR